MRASYVTIGRQVTFAMVAVLLVVSPVSARSTSDNHAALYGSPFYDETPVAACVSATVGASMPSGPVNFPANALASLKPVLTDIRSKQSFYQARVAGKNIPWELVASLEYRENNNNIDTSVDPLNGHRIDKYPYTNSDTKRVFHSYDEIWTSVFGHITGNDYGVKLAANGGLSVDDVGMIATSWRYGQKLIYKSGSNIPTSTTYHDNSYAYSGLDALHPLGGMPIIHWTGSNFEINSEKDDRLGVVVVYLALTGGGIGTISIGCGGTADGTPTSNTASTKLPYADKVAPAFGFSLNISGGHNMTYYSQDQDSRWNHLTGVFGPGHDIAECGCGPTSLAMIISTLGGSTIIPPEMTAYMRSIGAASDCGANGTGKFADIAKHYGINGKRIGSDWAAVDETLKNKHGLVAISMNQSMFGGNHYVVIRGIAADGNYLVANPLKGTNGGFAKTSLDSSHPQSDFNIDANNGMVAFWP